jgi:hypothetical protein
MSWMHGFGWATQTEGFRNGNAACGLATKKGDRLAPIAHKVCENFKSQYP